MMPQLSSTYRLIMAANDMSNALKNPHPEVPFSHIGDDTITAPTTLAKIFKNKFQKVQILGLPTAPPKVAERTFPAESSNPILASPMPPRYQTRSQTTIHAQDITNAPLLPRVATPMTSRSAPPRVPMRSQNLSPATWHKLNFWHGHCQRGNRPGKSPLFPAKPSQYSRSPNHWKRNGIHGPYERPSPATTLETRFWQQSRTPFSRHS
jgi:hypothetical protein